MKSRSWIKRSFDRMGKQEVTGSIYEEYPNWLWGKRSSSLNFSHCLICCKQTILNWSRATGNEQDLSDVHLNKNKKAFMSVISLEETPGTPGRGGTSGRLHWSAIGRWWWGISSTNCMYVVVCCSLPVAPPAPYCLQLCDHVLQTMHSNFGWFWIVS